MKNTKQEVPVYQCTDLYLAAYLVSEDERIIQVDKTNERRAVFLFEESPRIERLVEKYWDKSGSIEPRAYVSAIKEVKDFLYK